MEWFEIVLVPDLLTFSLFQVISEMQWSESTSWLNIGENRDNSVRLTILGSSANQIRLLDKVWLSNQV